MLRLLINCSIGKLKPLAAVHDPLLTFESHSNPSETFTEIPQPAKTLLCHCYSCFFVDVSGMNQLPPFDYDQDEESVTVNINLPDVKVEDISLGFTSRKASKSPELWQLFIQ